MPTLVAQKICKLYERDSYGQKASVTAVTEIFSVEVAYKTNYEVISFTEGSNSLCL